MLKSEHRCRQSLEIHRGGDRQGSTSREKIKRTAIPGIICNFDTLCSKRAHICQVEPPSTAPRVFQGLFFGCGHPSFVKRHPKRFLGPFSLENVGEGYFSMLPTRFSDVS